jgi:hypothetical protein
VSVLRYPGSAALAYAGARFRENRGAGAIGATLIEINRRPQASAKNVASNKFRRPHEADQEDVANRVPGALHSRACTERSYYRRLPAKVAGADHLPSMRRRLSSWQMVAGEQPVCAHKDLCSACRRVNDRLPAGAIALHGDIGPQIKDQTSPWRKT